MAKFEQFVDMFMDPKKFQAKMQQFKDASDDAKAQLDKVKVWGEVESAHGEIQSLLSGANSKFQQAKDTLADAEKKGALLVEDTHAKVRDINEESAKREKAVSERERQLAKGEKEVYSTLEKNEKTLAEIVSKTSSL